MRTDGTTQSAYDRLRGWLESPPAIIALLIVGLAGGLLTRVPMWPGLPGVHHLLVGGAGAAILLLSRRWLPAMGREQWQGLVLVGLLMLIGLVSAALSPFMKVSLVHTLRFVPLIVFGAGLLLLASRESGRYWIVTSVYGYLIALALTGVAEAGLTAWGLFPGLTEYFPTEYFPQWSRERIAGLTQNPNPYGALMVLAVLLWSFCRRTNGSRLVWPDLALLPILWALAASGSRSAWLGFALLCGLLVVFRLRTPVVAGLLLLVLLAFILANPVARERSGLAASDEAGAHAVTLPGVDTAQADAGNGPASAGDAWNIPLRSMFLRFELWGHSAQVFLERPWLGWGYGAYRQELVTNVLHEGLSPHNIELLVLVSTGICGFLVFVLATVRVLVSSAWAGPHLLVASLMVPAMQQAEEFTYSWAFVMTASALSAVALGAGRRRG